MTSQEMNPAIQVPTHSDRESSKISPFFLEALHEWDCKISLRIHEWGLKVPRAFLHALEYSALFRRPRPVYNKGMYLVVSVDHYSFPSGHSSRAFTILIFVLNSASEWKEMISPVLGVDELGLLGHYFVPFLFASWAVATASSRILLGRHFLLDVVVGSVLGILEAWFVINYLLDVRFFLDDQQRRVLEYGQHVKEAMRNFRL
ncbi:hypothetical protein GOP47_0006007 [Adiantum capillus-veneris]|uniref:Phosphatidic acid phosphatase type 2/haloperoxidase domain-containing protein n=1 Tax=Adiantum capillus-veneris TaxID=13818 RepID=A0A9D4V2R7_ADICA|nr:hypothetical protein GOP47_0006007 [Adiantum capillus-veneris]